MKKKVIILSSIIVTLVLIIILVVLLTKTKYTIVVSRVDSQSPDRILTVYKSKNEKVDVKKIEYLDGKLLCYGYNTAVHFGDIENVKELKVILKDGSEIIAKIIEEEVK